MQSNLVSAQWLSEHLNDDNVAVVDGSWHLPATQRTAREEFSSGHIAGAAYFDIDQCSEPGALPHMLPTADTFSRYAGGLGITEHQHVVVYDTVGVFSAARVWWMFRRYGVKQVSVLNGGLPAWLDAGYKLSSGTEAVKSPVEFNATVASSASNFEVVDAPQVLEAASQSTSVILDARPPGRFAGTEKEARPGLRSGRIPGSRNVPFVELLDKGFFKPDEELRKILNNAGVSDKVRVITSCGSGVTAAVICLALERIGTEHVALYDGSWTEWGGLQDMPVETN